MQVTRHQPWSPFLLGATLPLLGAVYDLNALGGDGRLPSEAKDLRVRLTAFLKHKVDKRGEGGIGWRRFCVAYARTVRRA